MVGVASRAAVGQAACQHAMLVRENGQWDATLSVHRAPRSPRSHSHWLRDAAQITTTPGCHSRAQHRPAARRTAGAAAGEAEESLVARSPRPKTGWWGRAVRLVNRHRRLSLRPRRACTSRRRGNTRNRARGVFPWDLPCEGGHATAASFAPRPTGQTSDASRETLPVAVAVRCVSRRARVSVDAFALGRPRPLLHRSPRPAQVRAQLRATRSVRLQPPPRGRDLPGV